MCVCVCVCVCMCVCVPVLTTSKRQESLPFHWQWQPLSHSEEGAWPSTRVSQDPTIHSRKEREREREREKNEESEIERQREREGRRTEKKAVLYRVMFWHHIHVVFSTHGNQFQVVNENEQQLLRFESAKLGWHFLQPCDKTLLKLLEGARYRENTFFTHTHHLQVYEVVHDQYQTRQTHASQKPLTTKDPVIGQGEPLIWQVINYDN